MHPSIATAEPRPLWWDGLEDQLGTRSALTDDLQVDVAILGGGYTGLWTAYELAAADPSLDIVVLERDHVGFGASGRNGGWCYDGFAAGMDRIEKMSDLDTTRRFGAALRETVDVVGTVVATEAIDCAFNKGGSVEFLRNHAQLKRAEEDVEAARRYGWSVKDTRVLSPGEAKDIARASNLQGGLWSRHTATVQPAHLAHGLAAAAERRGVRIFEGTEATGAESGTVTIEGGLVVRAPVIVRALEGYTAELPGHHRELTPLYSTMIATAPLPQDLWDEIGFADGQGFGDLRHMVIYGQRTADNRIAFGGRGAPYDYGSRIRRNADFPAETFGPIRNTLVELFPQLEDIDITHRWGGVLGVSRTWMPTVGFDPASGMGWAGGYVGSGVAATNLAGRTLAELITGRPGEISTFPWVNHRVRRWEPEPLRWLAFTAALKVMSGADKAEAKRGKPAKRADALWWLAEH